MHNLHSNIVLLKAGTVFPANDETAIGLVFNDVDVTNGDAPGAVLVEGWIIEERLPEPISELANLPFIKRKPTV